MFSERNEKERIRPFRKDSGASEYLNEEPISESCGMPKRSGQGQ